MNTTSEMLAVIAGFAEGKVVEFRYIEGEDEWGVIRHPMFDFSRCEYRLAKTNAPLREFFVIAFADKTLHAASSRDEAMDYVGGDLLDGESIIHVREVLATDSGEKK